MSLQDKNTNEFVNKSFNPLEISKKALKDNFVIRKEEYEEILENISDIRLDRAQQNYLIVGQRGMGKTTLMLRLRYEIEENPKLNKKLLPIQFPEEQYFIQDLASLWQYTIEFLSADYKKELGHLQALADEIPPLDDNFEEKLADLLFKELRKLDKGLILFIDNFGDLLDKLNDNELHRLRGILINSPYLRIIAGSSKVLERLEEHNYPFYDFFLQIRLKGISQEDTIKLLRAISKYYKEEKRINQIVEKESYRIDALRRLTGGVPRTMIILYGIFLKGSSSDTFEDLEALLNQVTPLYQSRMNNLKPQQQKIVDALARAWDGITTKELLEDSFIKRAGISSSQISAQLKQLEDNQIVTSKKLETSTKLKMYQLSERFFNIWYLMRNTRDYSKEKVVWLVKFFEIWCNDDEVKSMINQIVYEGNLRMLDNNKAFLMTETLINVANPEDVDKLYLLIEQFKPELTDKLSSRSQVAEANIKRVDKLIIERNFEEAHIYLNKCESYANELMLSQMALGMKFHSLVFNNKDFRYYSDIALDKILKKERLNIADKLALFGVFSVMDKREFLKHLHELTSKENSQSIYLLMIGFNSSQDLVGGNFSKEYGNFNFLMDDEELQNEKGFARLKIICISTLMMFDLFDQLEKIILKEQLLLVDSDSFKFILQAAITLKQYWWTYKLFTDIEFSHLKIIDKYKPIYYALMYFMKEDFPNEYLRAGEELTETINEIIKDIEAMDEEYKTFKIKPTL